MKPVWFIERLGIQRGNDAVFIRARINIETPCIVSMLMPQCIWKLVSVEQPVSNHKRRRGIQNFPPVFDLINCVQIRVMTYSIYGY